MDQEFRRRTQGKAIAGETGQSHRGKRGGEEPGDVSPGNGGEGPSVGWPRGGGERLGASWGDRFLELSSTTHPV